MTMSAEALDLVVVDDNPVLLRVLSEILRDCGHRVRVASNGFGALAEMRERVPDILLSDLCMPGMSGYELLSVVRRRYPSIRVIAMSGSYSDTRVPLGVAADAFFAKGASSVAQLAYMIRAIWSGEALSPRSSAPIWVSEVSTDHAGVPVLFVSCPECLRPFSQQLDGLEILASNGSCPHCKTLVELALVRQSRRTDKTPILIAPDHLQMSESTPEAEWSKGAPTGRMHPQ